MNLGQPVKVYRNLHKDQWSLMAADGPEKGRVIGYGQEVLILDPRLTVSEAGRQRAVREHRRNVHAFVVGTVGDLQQLRGPLYRVRYNPFRASCFTDALQNCVHRARQALLDREGFLWMDIDLDSRVLVEEAIGKLKAGLPDLDPEEVDGFVRRSLPELERMAQVQLGRRAEEADAAGIDRLPAPLKPPIHFRTNRSIEVLRQEPDGSMSGVILPEGTDLELLQDRRPSGQLREYPLLRSALGDVSLSIWQLTHHTDPLDSSNRWARMFPP